MAKQTSQVFEKIIANVGQFLNHFQAETDTGTVLVAGAYLDDLLASILRKHFVDESEIVNKLLKIDGPLGTFSTRIDLTYCLGLIRPDQHMDLNTCRKMRNKCAHTYHPLSFDKQPLVDLCGNLKQIELMGQLRKEMSTAEQELLIDRFQTNRQKFIGNVVHLAVGLMTRGAQLKHLELGKGFDADEAARLSFE